MRLSHAVSRVPLILLFATAWCAGVDARSLHPHVDAAIDMTDDLSGIVRLAILFRAPSNAQGVVSTIEPPAPAKKVGGRITIGATPLTEMAFMAFSEPGTWEAVLLHAYDANGNSAGYSQNQLRALGSTSFVVKNERYDIVPPTLVGGTIGTPNVRLSKAPKGTPPGTLPYVSADIRMTDSGNGAVSGAYAARIVFCAGFCAHSFSVSGLARRTGLGSTTLAVGTQLGEKQAPGDYQIFALALTDVAGNEVDYSSKAFGGDTDFDEFFAGGATVSIEE